MNNGFNKIDWSSYGYAMVYLGLPILLFGLSLETDLALTKTLIWIPLGTGAGVLLFFDRKQKSDVRTQITAIRFPVLKTYLKSPK